jgi:hypothetical protein
MNKLFGLLLAGILVAAPACGGRRGRYVEVCPEDVVCEERCGVCGDEVVARRTSRAPRRYERETHRRVKRVRRDREAMPIETEETFVEEEVAARPRVREERRMARTERTREEAREPRRVLTRRPDQAVTTVPAGMPIANNNIK